MTPLETTLLVALIIVIPITMLSLLFFFDEKQKNSVLQGKTNPYELKKYYQTPNEKHFFENLKRLSSLQGLHIFPQVHLSTFMGVKDSVYDMTEKFNYINKLYVDFAIFNDNFDRPLLIIELNDKTHTYKSRMGRDEFVKNALKSVHVPILTVTMREINDTEWLERNIGEMLAGYRSDITAQA